MNSKKHKKTANNNADDNSILAVKKTKKKKSELTNTNAILENKTRKRKGIEPETEAVAPKKPKKKKNVETTELILPEENIENEPSAKNLKQKNGHITAEMELSPTDPILDDVPKKGKKKKKTKLNLQETNENDLDIAVSTSTASNHINLIKVEDINSGFIDTKILHHEVNIVDVKDEKDNEGSENVVTISIKDEGLDSDWDENDLLKQLERKIEKKESPKERKVNLEWPDSDLRELIGRMEKDLPENDLKPYIKRTESLEWDKIAFKDYTPDDCKKTWNAVLKKIRRYRILKEVLQDAKEWISIPRAKKKPAKAPRHPDMPRRPLSAYFIYYLKKKDSMQAERQGIDATELAKMCSQKFKLLPPEKRLKYEKIANKNKEEYEQKMKEFYECHPEFKIVKEAKPKRPLKAPNPPKPPKPVIEKPPPKPPKEKVPKRPANAFHYYYLSEVSKEQVEDKVAFKELCKEKWKQMPDDKKIEWISYAEAETLKYEEEMKEFIQNHPEYVHTNQNKPQLTKEELLVKERLSGKPPKPPVSAYNLFARILLHSDDIKNIPVKERLVFVSNQWKECNEEEKKHYKDLFEKTMEKHNKDYAAYLESLPEEERKLEIEKNVTKRKKPDEEKKKKDPKPKKLVKKAESTPEKKKTLANKANSTVVNKPNSPAAPKVNSTPKKAEKKPKKLTEPEQPPISAFKYFATTYAGEQPAAKAWKALSSEEKKRYEDELVLKKKSYISDFEKFLKSMTKEELENFSNSRKKLNNQKSSEEDEEETSDQTDSEEDSNDDISGDDDPDD